MARRVDKLFPPIKKPDLVDQYTAIFPKENIAKWMAFEAGDRREYHFPNGWGVSLIYFPKYFDNTLDMWEIGILRQDDYDSWVFVEESPFISNDSIIRFFTEEEALDHALWVSEYR